MRNYDSITIKDFINMKEVNGGDLWNKYKLAAIAFTQAPADTVEIRYVLGTGLWCEITCVNAQEKKTTLSIYDHMSYKSKQEILEQNKKKAVKEIMVAEFKGDQ